MVWGYIGLLWPILLSLRDWYIKFSRHEHTTPIKLFTYQTNNILDMYWHRNWKIYPDQIVTQLTKSINCWWSILNDNSYWPASIHNIFATTNRIIDTGPTYIMGYLLKYINTTNVGPQLIFSKFLPHLSGVIGLKIESSRRQQTEPGT